MAAINTPTPYMVETLRDEYWRLNNLYHIIDPNGNLIRFRMNPEQETLYRNKWYQNVILKARQMGFSTLVQLMMLDRCLFTPNTTAGISAQSLTHAELIMRNKIITAYAHLPPEIKNANPTVRNNRMEVVFKNGSSIVVGHSLRSGSYNFLHISEFGKLYATYPAKAKEVITGTLNALPPEGFLVVESTAEGAYGAFYDMACQAQDANLREAKGERLTVMDKRLHFFPWFACTRYKLSDEDAQSVPISETQEKYFEGVETETGQTLSRAQRAWYVAKAREQGDMMQQEYPSTFDEAFTRTTEHAIYGKSMANARAEGRIQKHLPRLPAQPVYAFFDLGFTDATAIWCMQLDGAWFNFIHAYSNTGHDLSHYMRVLDDLRRDKGFHWGTIFLPHDGARRDIVSGTPPAKVLRDAGYVVRVVDRPRDKIQAINNCRQKFPSCRFDATTCKEGLSALAAYEWAFDEVGDTTKRSPLHSWASHYADAFQTFVLGFRADILPPGNEPPGNTSAGTLGAFAATFAMGQE